MSGIGSRWRSGVWAVVFLATVPLAAPASAAGFTLGAFDTYGLLVNDGVAGGDINTSPVNANIGIGNLTGQVNLHNDIINGKVDQRFSGDVTYGTLTGTQPVSFGGAAPSGSPVSVNTNVANVETAIQKALSLSSTYGAEAASGTAITLGGNKTINASSGFLDASGTRIFTASSFSIGNGNALTINGSASDYVVIDITGTSNNKLDGALSLAGGITSDQVLINFIGVGGSVQGAANGATLSGTFLIPNQAVTLNSLVINGHVFGGAGGTNFQFVSNAMIVQPPLDMPEPISLALFAAGLGVIMLLRSRADVRPSESS